MPAGPRSSNAAPGRGRRAALALLALAAGCALLVWGLTRGAPETSRSAAGRPVAEAGATRDVAARPAADLPPESAAAPADEEAQGDALFGADEEAALRWSLVDLDAVRDALPDNRYWQMSAPTDDAELLRLREEDAERWNTEYGKVLSGTATDAEVHAYYDHRERVSLDAIEFASYLLEQHGDTLPERDAGLLALAVRLHHARLEELPRRLAEALERRSERAALREAWLEDEAAFRAHGHDAERE